MITATAIEMVKKKYIVLIYVLGVFLEFNINNNNNKIKMEHLR